MSTIESSAQRERLLGFYGGISGWLKPAVELLVPGADELLASAGKNFEDMLEELPYKDRPEHTMANSMFACAAMLAIFEVLREHGVDAHAWGRAIHTLPSVVPQDDGEAAGEQARADGEASRSEAASNEFVFELLDGDEHSDRGMNVTSCAICHLFGKHDAMELVPYMCSLDDVMSDAGGQGLRRTGTIALGASHCDFRFREDGEPLRLADQYSEYIRL